MVKSHADRIASMKSRLELDPEALRWSPLVGNSVVNSEEETSMLSDTAAEAPLETESIAEVKDDLEASAVKKRGRKTVRKAPKKKVVERKTPKVEPRLRARPQQQQHVESPAVEVEKKNEPINNRRKAHVVEEEDISSNDWLRPRKRRNVESTELVQVKAEPTTPKTSRASTSKMEERLEVTPKVVAAPSPPASAKTKQIKPRGRPRKRTRPEGQVTKVLEKAAEESEEESVPPASKILCQPVQQPDTSPDAKSVEEEEKEVISRPASQSSEPGESQKSVGSPVPLTADEEMPEASSSTPSPAAVESEDSRVTPMFEKEKESEPPQPNSPSPSPVEDVTVKEEKGPEQMAEKIESDRASTCSPPVQEQFQQKEENSNSSEQSPVEEQKEESPREPEKEPKIAREPERKDSEFEKVAELNSVVEPKLSRQPEEEQKKESTQEPVKKVEQEKPPWLLPYNSQLQFCKNDVQEERSPPSFSAGPLIAPTTPNASQEMASHCCLSGRFHVTTELGKFKTSHRL